MTSTIRKNFEIAVADYVRELLKQFGWKSCYGYWVADDCTGVYAYGDEYYINLADIIYIVDNNVTEKEFDEWYSYCLWANDNDQIIPNLSAWMKGCPRLSKSNMERIDKAKQALVDLLVGLKENEEKENVWTT